MAKIDTFFTEMKEQGASDLHIVVGFPPLLRLNGELVPLVRHSVITAETSRELLFEILSSGQQAKVEKNRDFDMAYELEGIGRFRCNILYQHRGIGGVFRIIPTKILTIEQLNLPDIVRSIAAFTRGLVLVTGPTGSGKSTTLAAIVDYINDNWPKHIITI